MSGTFADLLLARADDDRVALQFEATAWSWRSVAAESMRRAAVVRSRFPSGQVHVGVLLENTPEYVFWLWAAALARITVVGINPTRRGQSLAADIRHTDCDLIVTDSERNGLLAGVDIGVPRDRVLLADDDGYADELRSVTPAAAPAGPADPADRMLLLFTSGSTGAPKAVVCSNGRLAVIAGVGAQSLGIRPDDRLYQSMPMFHGNAIMANLAPAVALAAPVALRRRFSASGFLPDVRRYDCSYFNYVGRSLAYILATSEQPDDATNSLRLGFGTEASLVDRQEFTRRFGCTLLESYGSSEGVIATYRPAEAPAASIGLPVPKPGSDVAVVDPQTGAECPPADFDSDGRMRNGAVAIGEIVDRGGAVGFEGYYRNDDAMAGRLRGGWYWSGDLAYRDADGYLYFAGRSNDWLRVDSENFAAAPVEAILSRHPGVVMAAVLAVPDPRTGDQVMAALELRPEWSFDREGFAEFLAAQRDLGTKWAPSFIRIVTTMPLTATNKVDKAPLRHAGWWDTGDDPVFHRAAGETAFRQLRNADRAELLRSFETHGRSALLPLRPTGSPTSRARTDPGWL